MDLERLVKMMNEKAEEKRLKRESKETMRGAETTYQEFSYNAERETGLQEMLASLRGNDAGV